MDTIIDDDDDIMTIESSDSEYEYNDSELESESESVFLEEIDNISIKDSNEEIHFIKLYNDDLEPETELETEQNKLREYSEQIFDDLVNEERETIIVNKEAKVETESETETEVETLFVDTKNNQTNYQKMNVPNLRILAISKGLCSDTSKLKRVDLIKLLESEN